MDNFLKFNIKKNHLGDLYSDFQIGSFVFRKVYYLYLVVHKQHFHHLDQTTLKP